MENEIILVRAKALGEGKVCYIPVREVVMIEDPTGECEFKTRQDRKYKCVGFGGSNTFNAALFKMRLNSMSIL